MRKILLSTFVAAMCFMPKANAADKVGGYVGLDAGYGGLTLGAQSTADALAKYYNRTALVTQERGVGLGRIYGGVNIDKHFGLEIGYLTTSEVTTNATVATSPVTTGTAKNSSSGIDYSLVVKPIDTQYWSGIFLKIGGHSLETTTKWSGAIARASTNPTFKGSGLLFGIGYESPLSSNVDYRVAYTHYNNVSGESDFSANIVSVGVLAKF